VRQIFAISVCALMLMSCNKNAAIENKANSTVEAMNGIYVFIKSKPINRYEYLGSIELKWYDRLTDLDRQNIHSAIKSLAGIISFSDNLENTLAQVKQKYPTADGVIFDDQMSRCEVILFK